MPRRRIALISFDPDRIAELNQQAEGQAVAWIIINALQGRDYPRERGIEKITLLDVVPPTRG